MTPRLQVIRVVALLAVVLSFHVALPVTVAGQVPHSLRNEDVFFYRLAICGEKPSDWVNFWGMEFDRANYQRATANEFSRQEYRDRTKAMLQRRFDGLSFTTKFSAVFSGVLGEYSFSNHGFPLGINSHLRFNIGGASIYIAQPDQVINMADYRWFVPMAQAQASAYVKSHQDNNGNVDRKVLLNITYSIVETTQKCRPYDVWLKSYIHSVEVLDPLNPGTKLATLTPFRGTFEEVLSEVIAKRNDPNLLDQCYTPCRITISRPFRIEGAGVRLSVSAPIDSVWGGRESFIIETDGRVIWPVQRVAGGEWRFQSLDTKQSRVLIKVFRASPTLFERLCLDDRICLP